MAGVKPRETPVIHQLLLVGFFAFVLMPMAGARFVSMQLAKEQAGVLTVFGAARGAAILDRGDGWFRRGFVDTGMVRASLSERVPPVEPTAPTPGTLAPASSSDVKRGPTTPATDNAMKKLSRHWVGGAWSILYLMFVRLSSLLAVVPLVVPIAVAVLVEGAARRKLKWYSFGGSEPRLYVIGLRMGVWCAAIAILALGCPGALPALAIPVVILLSATGFALWTANQQKPM